MIYYLTVRVSTILNSIIFHFLARHFLTVASSSGLP